MLRISDSTVARAAPSTSMWNTAMNRRSSTMFVSELATRQMSGNRLSPDACRMLTNMLYITSAPAPPKYTCRYRQDRSNTVSGVPMSRSMPGVTSTPKAVSTTLKNSPSATAVCTARSVCGASSAPMCLAIMIPAPVAKPDTNPIIR